jgi:hypothetical protein
MAKKESIAGNTFLFTGKLTEFTREDAEAHVEAEGGTVLSGVSAKLNYLVVGEDAGSKLAKAKALGTVTILQEREFLKMMNSGKKAPGKSVPKKAPAKATPKKNLPAEALDRNEIQLHIQPSDLKKMMKKHVSANVTEKILTVSDSILCFSDIASDDKSFFYYSEANGKLIMNYLLEDVEDEIRLSEEFFKELSKHTKSDFKIVFLDRNLWELSFCVFSKGKLSFESSSVSDWEDPFFFDDVPYFVKLAKANGLKMKKDEFGINVWDSEEVYNLIYDFRDNLLSGDEYLNLAPEWYLALKSISN